MRSLKLTAVLICLILIGILPKNSGQNNQPAIATIVSDAVSANGEFHPGLPRGVSGDDASPLALGEEIFMKHCSACHSTRFVWQSGILAGEAESVVATMLAKDRINLNSRQHNPLLEYLNSRLPKN